MGEAEAILKETFCDSVPIICLTKLKYNDYRFDSESVGCIQGELLKWFDDFYNTYDDVKAYDCYMLEDVIHEVFTNNFTKLMGICGVDIIYSRYTIHVRFKSYNDRSEIYHSDVLYEEDFIACDDSLSLDVRFTKFRLNDYSECWEYAMLI
ncbi:MAG: hypothetical protein NC131_17925 [Roseburia sp.]|nr:hypothetical protein [Roseburia sp.]